MDKDRLIAELQSRLDVKGAEARQRSIEAWWHKLNDDERTVVRECVQQGINAVMDIVTPIIAALGEIAVEYVRDFMAKPETVAYMALLEERKKVTDCKRPSYAGNQSDAVDRNGR